MNVGWNLLTGTVTRYLRLAVNVCLGIFLVPDTVRHLGAALVIGSLTARAGATSAPI